LGKVLVAVEWFPDVNFCGTKTTTWWAATRATNSTLSLVKWGRTIGTGALFIVSMGIDWVSECWRSREIKGQIHLHIKQFRPNGRDAIS